jgi:hypothetical protein
VTFGNIHAWKVTSDNVVKTVSVNIEGPIQGYSIRKVKHIQRGRQRLQESSSSSCNWSGLECDRESSYCHRVRVGVSTSRVDGVAVANPIVVITVDSHAYGI